MTNDSKKIFKLYENVANLGPAAETPVGPSSNSHVMLNIPSGFAVKDEQNEIEQYPERRKEMVKANLLSTIKSVKSIGEDFRKLGDVPPWVEEEIAIVSKSLQDIADYYNGKTA